MLNYTNYATLTAQNIMSVGRFIRFSSKSEGNTLLLCSFRIHTLYLRPCFKLPLLDLMLPANKGSSAYSQSNVSSSFSVVVRTRNLQCLVRIEKTLNVTKYSGHSTLECFRLIKNCSTGSPSWR